MTTTHSSSTRYRWFILSIGVLAQIVFAIGFAGIPLSGVIMRSDYHLSMGELGFVLGCMGLGVGISEIVWGILTDKLGDKVVLMIGLASMGATYAIIAYGFVPGGITDYRALGSLLILAGAVGGSINSSSGRAVMTWFQDHERGFAMSIRQTAIPVGAAIGSITIPFIASSYGFGLAFSTLAALSLIVTLVVWIWMVELEIPEASTQNVSGEGVSPLKRMSVWKIALAGAALTFPQMSILTFASVFLTDQHHMSLFVVSIIAFSIQLGGGVLRLVTGRITDKYQNRRNMLRWISVIAGIAGILLGLLSGQNEFLVVGLLIITGLAGNAWHGVGYTEIAVAAGVRYAGRALGMMGATVFAVSFVIPYMIPFILKMSSWSGVWIFVGIASLLALPLIFESAQPMKKNLVAKEGDSVG
ncbi:MFS transporter [Baia soyae]|uniref:Sugar phosphate permease n=1 Tax=Baia soyae TaxID=1544746 RepID=A0A4R2S2I6_9BACL|nr:MFS transporter [Baia soyae]TCP66541.1 sugar phosphate permease [Baia soyae]